MPGRDELLQQNIARAQSKAASPQPQETVGRGPVGGIGGPRSFLGGNYDVYSALESIEFQGALGDASMRGNIAYIRVWKRGGTAAQTNSGAVTQDPGGADALTALDSALVSEWGKFFPKTNTDTSVIFNGDPSTLPLDPSLSYAVDGANFNRDEDGNIISGFIETTFSPTPNPQRQQALGTQTPTTSGVQITSTQIVSPVAFEAQVRPQQNLNNGTGQVRSANPNGFTNALLNFGQSFIGGGGGGGFGQVSYSGQANAPRGGAVAVPASGDMMWQFLFNPSELQLEAGPEFKGAEVWGVSDKANSGQPLHWSHNKNASLKFNSVLLNGFVFGRKVEALEQGLLELFMSREGEGQHGPHVLEFVWGKRSFGPCVIKNIDVKEKMWDEGEVVNAELSFTLEQVPEWTINDGAYVDVARPGRRPLANDPTQANNAAAAPAAAPTPTPAPGGGSSPAQKPSQNQDPSTGGSAYRACQKAFELVEVFSQVEISGNLAKANFRGDNGIVLINGLFRKYEAAYSQGNSSVGTNFISRVPPQQKPPSVRKSLDSMITAGAAFERQVDLVRNAALRCKAAMQNTWDSDCKKLIADGKAAQTGAQNANNNQALCSGITVGRPCNIGAGNFSPKNPCSGKVLRCNGRGAYEDI